MIATTKRFSRNSALETLETWAAALEREYGWDYSQGRVVVDGAPDATKIDFGRYECLLELIDEFRQ